MKKRMPVEDALKFWIDHGNRSSGRVNVVTVIEIATFAGWYVLCKDGEWLLAFLMVMVATMVSVVMYRMIELDIANADSFRIHYENRVKVPDRESMSGEDLGLRVWQLFGLKVGQKTRGRWIIRVLASVLLICNLVLMGLALLGHNGVFSLRTGVFGLWC